MERLAEEIRRRAGEAGPRLTALRRHLHRHPEPAWGEYLTASLVARALQDAGFRLTLGANALRPSARPRQPEAAFCTAQSGRALNEGADPTLVACMAGGLTGLWGDLDLDSPGTPEDERGPLVAFRFDMDANAGITEATDKDHFPAAQGFASCHTGCMHACGHDGHTAILLATAQHLSVTRNFSGTVHFVFQPAEENLAGAQKMIEDGLFELFPMDAIYGLHNWPGYPAGQVVINPGPMMASLDTFEIRLTGKGCHAAMPEKGADPIVAAAELVLGLQSIVSRRLSPLDSAVVSVTQIQAGEAINVIPESAVLKGTVRCLQTPVRAKVQRLIGEFVEQLPAAFGVEGVLTYNVGYPVTENDPEAAAQVRRAAVAAVGEENVLWGCNPSMASEDFSFMLQACPGAYVWLGVDGEQPSAALDLCSTAHPKTGGTRLLLTPKKPRRASKPCPCAPSARCSPSPSTAHSSVPQRPCTSPSPPSACRSVRWKRISTPHCSTVPVAFQS